MKSAHNITPINIKLTRQQRTSHTRNAIAPTYQSVNEKKAAAGIVAKRLSDRRDKLSRAILFLKKRDDLFPNGTKIERARRTSEGKITSYAAIKATYGTDNQADPKDITPPSIRTLDHSLLKINDQWGALVKGSSIFGNAPIKNDGQHAIEKSRGKRNVRFWVREDGAIFTVKVVKIKKSVVKKDDDFPQEADNARELGGEAHKDASNTFRSDDNGIETHYFLDAFQGHDLLTLLESNALSLTQLIEIYIQCFERIEELRVKGYVHLDIKPENFAVKFDPDTGKPIVTLLDFAFAEKLDDPLTSIFDSFQGSIDYMPEAYAKGYKNNPNESPCLPFNYTTDIFAWTKSVLKEEKKPASTSPEEATRWENFKATVTVIQETAQERIDHGLVSPLDPEAINTSMQGLREQNKAALDIANQQKIAQLAEEAAQERKAIHATIVKEKLAAETVAHTKKTITVNTHTESCPSTEAPEKQKELKHTVADYDDVIQKKRLADDVVSQLNDPDTSLSKTLQALKTLDDYIPNNIKIKRSKKKNNQATYTQISAPAGVEVPADLESHLKSLAHSLLKIEGDWFVIVKDSSIYRAHGPIQDKAAIDTSRGERTTKLAVRESDGAIFSIKIIKTKKHAKKEDDVEQEADTIYAAKSAEAYAGHRDDNDINVDYLLEEFHGHSLTQYFGSGQCSLKDSIEIFIQCFEWIEKLRQRGYAHADIKPDNFAVKRDPQTEKLVVTLIDFGHAEVLDDPLHDSWQGRKGTFGFIPDAYESSGGHFNYFTDILAWTKSIKKLATSSLSTDDRMSELWDSFTAIIDNIHDTINAEINNNPSAQPSASLTPEIINTWMRTIRACNDIPSIPSIEPQNLQVIIHDSTTIKNTTTNKIKDTVEELKDSIKQIIINYNNFFLNDRSFHFKHGKEGKRRAESLNTKIQGCTSVIAIRVALHEYFEEAKNHNHSLIHFFVTHKKQNETETFVQKHGNTLGLREDIIQRCQPVEHPTKADKEARRELIETIRDQKNTIHVSKTVEQMRNSVAAIAALYVQQRLKNSWTLWLTRCIIGDEGLDRAALLQEKVKHAENVKQVLSAIHGAEKLYAYKDSGTHAYSLNSYFEDFLITYEKTLKNELSDGKRSIFEEFKKKSAVSSIHDKTDEAKDARRAIKEILAPPPIPRSQ